MTTHWTERLSEYHDGELSPAESDGCEAHLAECAECRGVLEEIRDVARHGTKRCGADAHGEPVAGNSGEDRFRLG